MRHTQLTDRQAAEIVTKNHDSFSALKKKYGIKNAENIERIENLQKKRARNKIVKSEIKEKIEDRLQQIANKMLPMGYSMGEVFTVNCTKKYSARNDNTSEYARSCKYRATHGNYTLNISPEKLRDISIVGGLITWIDPKSKGKIKKAEYASAYGNRQNYRITWKKCFLVGDFHAPTMEDVRQHIDWLSASKLENKQKQILLK